MKSAFLRTLLTASVFVLFASSAFSSQPDRIALVIGNASYKSSPLRNPVNDATDIAGALRDLGFSVTLKTDADQRTMEQAIHDFGIKLRLGGAGLFYFAGHGMQVDGSNYLIPLGANIQTESDIRYEAVDAGRVLGKMEDAGNGMNIVILDACRDNPFSRSFRSGSRGLARMDAPKGSLIAYATAPGQVAADGKRRNGVFTQHLLRHLVSPGLKVEDILKRTRNDVMRETGDQQVPWESSSLRGDFYFASTRGIAIEPLEPTTSPESLELQMEREKLKRERLELERLKLDIERKKIEDERRRLALAATAVTDWTIVSGRWEINGQQIRYLGPDDPNATHPYGIILSKNRRMTNGTLETKISIPKAFKPDKSTAAILFRYRPGPGRQYYALGLGAWGSAYVLMKYQTDQGWQGLMTAGDEASLSGKSEYNVEAHIAGSKVTSTINSFTDERELPEPVLDGSHIGLYAWGTVPVEFRDTRVIAKD